MDTYKIKFTRVQNEIFRLFCIKAGTFLNQRTVAKMIGISPTTVANALPLLEKEGLVKLEKGNNINLNLVSLNRDSEKAIFFKKIENLKILYESRVIQFLYNKFPGSTIILFGSYARGEDTVQSDIDIAIIGSKDKEVDLKEFDKKLEHAVNLNFYVSLKNVEKHLKNNLLNGIVLSGSIEL